MLLAVSMLGGALTGCRPVEIYDTKETERKEETMMPETERETEPVIETEPVPETEPPVLVESIGLRFHAVSLSAGNSVPVSVTTEPTEAEDHGVVWSSSDSAVAVVDEGGAIRALSVGQCVVTVTSVGNPSVSDSIAVTVNEAKACTYIDGLLIANKTYALPQSYALGVDSEAYNSLLLMFAAAAEDGYSLWLLSGYRSYEDQDRIYNNYVARDGQAEADRYSARPGHSEHQSGLAFDLNSLYQSFGETEEGIWLAENCHRFGFIIRYPSEKESITGYMYEPWHVRYIGVEMAQKVKDSGLCLEEYFGITSSYENAVS